MKSHNEEAVKVTSISDQVAAMKKILENKGVGLFMEHSEMIQALLKMSDDECMKALNLFYYGYIVGKREERDRKKNPGKKEKFSML